MSQNEEINVSSVNLTTEKTLQLFMQLHCVLNLQHLPQ